MEFNNTMPIYLQVIRDIQKELMKGELKLGSKLPSARELAIQYQINPNTANRIYRELEQKELCFSKRGLGTFVTEDRKKLLEIREEIACQLIRNFISEMRDFGFSREETLQEVSEKYEKVEE